MTAHLINKILINQKRCIMKRAVYFTIISLLLFFSFTSKSFSQITSAKSGNWDGDTTWAGGIVPTVSDNVVIASGMTVTINTSSAACNNLEVTGNLYFDGAATGLSITVSGNLSVDATGKFISSKSTPSSGQYYQSLDLRGDLIVLSGGAFVMRKSSGSNLSVVRVLFSGNADSHINLTQTTYSSSAEQFNSVEINKTGGAKVILVSGNLFQNNNSSNGPDTLVLTSGVIETGSNMWVTLRTSNEAIVGASELSYINGIVGHGISNGGGEAENIYPVGDALTYRPINVRFNAPVNGTGHFVWATLHSGNANTGSSTFSGGIDKVSEVRYYEVGYVQGGGSASAMAIYGFDPTYKTDDGVTSGNTNLRVAYSTDNKATWNNAGPTGIVATLQDTLVSDSLAPNISLATGTSMFAALASVTGTTDNPLPVELTTFTYKVNDNKITLNWSTATETNNSGFEIQRSIDKVNFTKIAFVKGAGSSTSLNNYTFTDENTGNNKIVNYRLNQVDLSGRSSYSNIIEVNLNVPSEYNLGQNYPNPFNPSTKISYSIAKSSLVRLSIYNTLGQKVKEVVNGFQQAGSYSVDFNASSLESGVYFYKLESGNFVKTMKLLLLK